MPKRTLKEIDTNADAPQSNKRRKLNDSNAKLPKKSKKTKDSEKKVKSSKVKKETNISMKGFAYKIGSFESGFLTTYSFPDFKIMCKSNKMTIAWFEMYPVAHYSKIEIILSDIESIHIGATSNKQAIMTVITDQATTPTFYWRAHVKGKTGFANPYKETTDFTKGNALENHKHELILRCKPTKKILKKLFNRLVNCGKF